MDNPPAKLSQDITFEWSPELLATCARRYLLRQSRRTQVIILLLLALGVFCLVKGMMGGWVLVGLSIWFTFLLSRQYLRAVKLVEEIPDRKVTVRVDPESITFKTSQKESTLKWPQIKEAWSSPDSLMLFPQGTAQYIALPVTPLGEDLQKYIETNIRQNGGKIS
jgi:hypothetical protein